MAKRQLLWIVNHKTLLPAEVPIIRSLGYEVFIPKIIPDDPGYRSAVVSYEYDRYLDIAPDELDILNKHDFYSRKWSPTIKEIINKNFSALVSSFSTYIYPLSEGARHFDGLVMARVFGREHPVTYTSATQYTKRTDLLDECAAIGDRFIFAQAFENLSEVEADPFKSKARTITVPMPVDIFKHSGTWRGGGKKAIFLCPGANDGGYHENIYNRIKRHFGDTLHSIFGRQYSHIDDPAILPYLDDNALIELYQTAPVFPYPHTEPRHLHYSPLEAMVVGTPVLYLKGTELDALAGGMETEAACRDCDEMREKMLRILNGDKGLAMRLREPYARILAAVSNSTAKTQWAAALGNYGSKGSSSYPAWPAIA